jgi:hyaluronan synthase
MFPVPTLVIMMLACIISAALPALVHQRRYGGWFGWRWAIPYAFFWVFCLCWISLWGLVTAPRSGWLTREPVKAIPPSKLLTVPQPNRVPKVFSKAA